MGLESVENSGSNVAGTFTSNLKKETFKPSSQLMLETFESVLEVYTNRGEYDVPVRIGDFLFSIPFELEGTFTI